LSSATNSGASPATRRSLWLRYYCGAVEIAVKVVVPDHIRSVLRSLPVSLFCAVNETRSSHHCQMRACSSAERMRIPFRARREGRSARLAAAPANEVRSVPRRSDFVPVVLVNEAGNKLMRPGGMSAICAQVFGGAAPEPRIVVTSTRNCRTPRRRRPPKDLLLARVGGSWRHAHDAEIGRARAGPPPEQRVVEVSLL